jgi:large subunit ribosomal protein L21
MYAIVEIGGKQYKVEKDMILDVEKVGDKETNSISFETVLMSVDGDSIKLGKPYIEGAVVKATVLDVIKGKKVHGVKFKKRKNYTRTVGHRHQYLRVKIEDLTA